MGMGGGPFRVTGQSLLIGGGCHKGNHAGSPLGEILPYNRTIYILLKIVPSNIPLEFCQDPLALPRVEAHLVHPAYMLAEQRPRPGPLAVAEV